MSSSAPLSPVFNSTFSPPPPPSSSGANGSSPVFNSTLSPPTGSPTRSSSSGVSAAAGSVIGGLIIVTIVVCVILRRRRRRKRLRREEEGRKQPRDSAAASLSGAGGRDQFIPSSKVGPRIFSYEELSIATKNFSESEVLGRGGFGMVYKGKLPQDGSLVAVKCIAENSNQGLREFKAEASIISDLRHRNLVRLKGWCYEQENQYLLVYEFLPNGSLDNLLFNDEQCGKLTWERRYSIALGLGSALQYLHEECDTVILHRDVKSSNVLLDDSFTAKLGDFGLSRQMSQGITSHSTLNIAGTRGYMAPECAVGSGRATRESDMYAFGAVLLELVCGKRALDASLPQYDGMLVDWVWQLHSQGRLVDVVDMRLGGRVEREEAERMLVVGLACSHPEAKARPKIRSAMEALLKTVALPFVPPSKPIPIYASPPPRSISQVLYDSTTGSSGAPTTSTSSSSNPIEFYSN